MQVIILIKNFNLVFSETLVSNMHRVTDNDEENVTHPRGTVPKPTEYEPLNLSMSPIPPEIPKKSTDESLDISSEASSESSLVDLGTKPLQVRHFLPLLHLALL